MFQTEFYGPANDLSNTITTHVFKHLKMHLTSNYHRGRGKEASAISVRYNAGVRDEQHEHPMHNQPNYLFRTENQTCPLAAKLTAEIFTSSLIRNLFNPISLSSYMV